MNAIVPASSAGGSGMIPTDMGAAMRLAEMMSTGRLVPQHLQKSPGDCLMVVELAMRFRMSPFAVAQCTSVIQGKLMLEGKLVAAAINSSGVLEDRLSYDFAGANDTRSVTVKGTMRGETSPREMTVTLKEAKTTNALWTKQPDQQLVYFGTRAWARRHAPEVMLGVYSPEEFPAADIPVRDTFAGPTIEHAAPSAAPVRETSREQTDSRPPDLGMARQHSDERQTAWLDKLEAEVAEAIAEGSEAVDAILARPDVQAAQDRARNGHKERLDHILQEAIRRTAADETTAPDDGVFADPEHDPFRQPVTA
jgi:hypothetical protein